MSFIYSEDVDYSNPPAEQEDGRQYFPIPADVWDHIDVAMVRPRAEWIDFKPGSGSTLQLGCGAKIIRGAANYDFPDWDAEHETRWELRGMDNASCAQVISYHTLDHLEPWAVVRTLRMIQRVLKPGGTFINIVPHYLSQLANECIMHKSRFGIDTFRNIFSERQYDHAADGGSAPEEGWKFEIGANFIYGQAERNMVLVTQLVKVGDDA